MTQLIADLPHALVMWTALPPGVLRENQVVSDSSEPPHGALDENGQRTTCNVIANRAAVLICCTNRANVPTARTCQP